MGMTQPFSFLSPITLTFDLDIRTRVRLLYNAPNHQVSSSYVESFGSYRADKQTDAAENVHFGSLRYAGG